MKTIPLTNSKEYAIVDDEDYAMVLSHNWYLNNSGYPGTTIKGKTVSLHHFVTRVSNEIELDHKNRKKLDAQKNNLRICDRTSNLAQRDIQKHNTSGYKGVSWDKNNKKYRAYVQVRGKHIALWKICKYYRCRQSV